MNPPATHQDSIRSRPCPVCLLCGARGEPLYQGLSDRLFGAPGMWNFSRCPAGDCGLVWLDPMPLEEDLPLAYREYHTHDDPPDSPRGPAHWLYHVFLVLTGLARERAVLRELYLGGMTPGRLLEVGCGGGAQLAHLRAFGWEVEGQEIDPLAARQARARHGLRVHLGPLPSLRLPDAAYDAVVMNHVIEHAADPVPLLTECRRLLKPGGVLVAVTPNIASLGHRVFGSNWRGLDPPRHLHLFSTKTLCRAAQLAGFDACESWTTAARAVGSALGSMDIRCAGRHRIQHATETSMNRKARAVLFQLRAKLAHLFQPGSGEECVLRARK